MGQNRLEENGGFWRKAAVHTQTGSHGKLSSFQQGDRKTLSVCSGAGILGRPAPAHGSPVGATSAASMPTRSDRAVRNILEKHSATERNIFAGGAAVSELGSKIPQ
jgi:hypothetical protein